MITNNINPAQRNNQNFKALIFKTPKQQCLQDLAQAVTNPTKRAKKETALNKAFEEIDLAKRYLEQGGMDFSPKAPDLDVNISIKKGQKVVAEVFDKPTQKVINTFKSSILRSPSATIKKATCAASLQSSKNQVKHTALASKVDKLQTYA